MTIHITPAGVAILPRPVSYRVVAIILPPTWPDNVPGGFTPPTAPAVPVHPC